MEGRRGARVATTFLVAIEDIDTAPKLRQGDISQTGVYFETTDDVGVAGTIHWLRLVSVDHARHLRVMACVVRVAMRGRLKGAAFEFMPESDDAVATLQNFVKYALGLRAASGSVPHIVARLDADATPRESQVGTRPAVVGKLSVRSMVLETSWAVQPGESLRVDIAAPGMTRRIRLEGKAVRVAPNAPASPTSSADGAAPNAGPQTYTIEVEVHEESERPLAHSSMSFEKVTPPQAPLKEIPKPATSVDDVVDESLRTLDDLLASLIAPAGDDGRRRRPHHLAGQIASVPLPTLASLFEMERMTGELIVRHGTDGAHVFVDSGRIVDVTPLGPSATARERIRAILGWRDGTFEFDVRPVQRRKDRIEMSITALLLDLAREDDEADRDRSE